MARATCFDQSGSGFAAGKKETYHVVDAQLEEGFHGRAEVEGDELGAEGAGAGGGGALDGVGFRASGLGDGGRGAAIREGERVRGVWGAEETVGNGGGARGHCCAWRLVGEREKVVDGLFRPGVRGSVQSHGAGKGTGVGRRCHLGGCDEY